ncbi:MAG: leucyl aminopeptidase [Candidatus Schekmanbacteria bacterium]|nr:leucyl aminopeptidase [Candidatus Schekmanbacteria bacterium]
MLTTIPAFHVTPLGDRSSRAIMLAIFEEVEENQAHLLKHLGAETAEKVMRLLEGRHVVGKYKEFNLLMGDSREHGLEWILLMGLGKKTDITQPYRLHDRIRSVVAIAARHFRRKHLSTFCVDDYSDLGLAGDVAAKLIVEGAKLGLYRYDRYKAKQGKKDSDETPIQAIYILTEGDPEVLRKSAHYAEATCSSTLLARDLVNTPPTDLTPLGFAEQARQMAETTPGLAFELLDKAAMERERMGLHLAVSRGSDNPPCVSVLTYRGRPDAGGWDLGLVGKGVTFDAGGYDIKPGGSMYRMYGDMAGAAAVAAAVRSIAVLGLKLNVAAVMPLSENLINGSAYKPGDILTSRKGLTVEITNTDAEGRLLLADSLHYTCERFKPTYLIDIATLTGAIVVALGHFVSGLFTHATDRDADDKLAADLLAAGRQTGEWLWRLPVDDDYRVQLSSDVADIENAAIDRGAGAGSITASVFLKEFVDFEVVKAWAHLDIAGTALMEKTLIYNKCPYQPKEGGTGIGARLLTRFAETLQ